MKKPAVAINHTLPRPATLPPEVSRQTLDEHTPWLLVAHLLRPQGRKGELLADLHTERPDRFGDNARVYLAAPGFSGPESEAQLAHVTSFWLPTGKSRGRVVLGLDISQSIGEAEQLAGMDVLVPLRERLPLQDDAVYIHDLIGCQVLDGAVHVGVISDVLSLNAGMETEGAPEVAPVLVVLSPEGAELLLPFARAYLDSVDLEHRRVVMHLPQALLDIYRPGSAAQKRKATPNESTG